MASNQVTGEYFLARGNAPDHYEEFARHSSTDFAVAKGSSNSLYVDGVHKPDNEGLKLVTQGGPPHVGPGQNLYVGIVPDADVTIDSDDPLAVIFIQIQKFDLNGNETGTKLFSRVSQKNDDQSIGGVQDDRSANQDLPQVVYAFGPVPAQEVWTIYGIIQLDIRDDVA